MLVICSDLRLLEMGRILRTSSVGGPETGGRRSLTSAVLLQGKGSQARTQPEQPPLDVRRGVYQLVLVTVLLDRADKTARQEVQAVVDESPGGAGDNFLPQREVEVLRADVSLRHWVVGVSLPVEAPHHPRQHLDGARPGP